MNNQKRMLAFLVLLAASIPAGAGDIYKRVNEDGVTEFSDKPFPGASQVNVNPNVVTTNPVQRRARASTPADAGEPAAPASRRSSVAADTQTTSTVRARPRRAARAEENQRENRRESRNYRSNRDEATTDPNPGRAIRNAVRNAPSPGPR